MSLLLENSADVELPDNYGQSPLFMACWKGELMLYSVQFSFLPTTIWKKTLTLCSIKTAFLPETLYCVVVQYVFSCSSDSTKSKRAVRQHGKHGSVSPLVNDVNIFLNTC